MPDVTNYHLQAELAAHRAIMREMAAALEGVLAEWEQSDAYYKYLYTQHLPPHIAKIQAALATYRREEQEEP